MWIQVSIFFLSCLSFSPAQDQASFVRSIDPSERCHYTFTVVSPEESSCPGSIPNPDVDGILARLSLLEALVSQLIGDDGAGTGLEAKEKHSQVHQDRNQLQEDNQHLNQQVQELQRRLKELSQEAEDLRQRPCQQTHTPQTILREDRPTSDLAHNPGEDAYQEMKAEVTQVQASHLIPDGNHTSTLSCGELLSVGDPEMHRKADTIVGKYGVWLQDPEPQGSFYTNETVWRIDAVGKDVRQLFAYEDMDQFTRGFPMKVLVLPESVESTGATIYRGSLYYQLRRSRTLIRYNLTSETVESRLELPYAGFHGQYPYSWGGYTDIDFAADEQGLWVIYSTSRAKGAIVISQLHPKSVEVERSWETNIRKNTVANAFMVCGRLYTVASYTAANTHINYMFDTSTGEGRTVSIPFKNKYRYNSMVDYNHALRKLHAWDNFHMVTYSLQLGRANSSRT